VNTDIELLHRQCERSANGTLVGRGSGKTFLKIHELAQTILLGETKRIFVIITSMYDMRWLQREIHKVFVDYELPYRIVHHIPSLTANGVHVQFVPEHMYTNEYEFCRGYTDYIIIFMRHED